MTIPAEHQGRYVYHMTHLDNLPSIIQHGLLCTNQKDQLGIKHHNIAYQDIQKRRAEMDVTAGPGGKVHDYVPFYFCAKNPMLYAQLQKKNIDQHLLIILAVPMSILLDGNSVFTNIAANSKNQPLFFDDPIHLNKLQWPIIDSLKAVAQENYQHKMAEALIYKNISFDKVEYISVFNDYARNVIDELQQSHGLSIRTKSGSYYPNTTWAPKGIHHYYTRFSIPSEKNQTLVIGPELLFSEYKTLIEQIPLQRNEVLSYHNIEQALAALDANPRILAELNALDGLQPAKRPHWQDALAHTLNVVTQIQSICVSESIEPESAKILKLAAYLHDIGKANSPRNADGKYEPDPNHPERAIELLGRIFTEEINLSNNQLNLVCKLVVYHDLIGDVIGKGRHREQILQVVDSIGEFDLLACICIADVQSLQRPGGGLLANFDVNSWISKIQSSLPELRTWVEEQLAARNHA